MWTTIRPLDIAKLAVSSPPCRPYRLSPHHEFEVRKRFPDLIFRIPEISPQQQVASHEAGGVGIAVEFSFQITQ